MQSHFKYRAIAILALCSAIGGQEAMAWCPTATNRTITCNLCTVVLTCDVPANRDPIIIKGGGVTLDGNWHNIYDPKSHGIHIQAPRYVNTTIKNIYINNPGPTGAGIYADISYDWDNLYLTNVYANGGLYGLQHGRDGRVVIAGGSYWDNNIGIYGYGGEPDARGIEIAGTYVWANQKGTLLQQKNRSVIRNSAFENNSNGASGHGLEMVNSSLLTVTGNNGSGNSGFDCKSTNSSGTHSGNTWGTKSGCP